MTEQRSPDDDEIIELTEVVELSAAGDEDIIELTEVVEPSAAGDEDIIELTEVVEPSAAGDEDIIELTEVVEPRPPMDEDIIELTEIVTSPQAEEEIIDLVDIVEEAPEAEVSAIREKETHDVDETAVAGDDAQPPNTDGDIETPVEERAILPEDAAFDLLHGKAPEAAASDNAALDGELDFAPMDLDIEENNEDLFDSLGMKLEPELQGAVGNDELDFNLSTQELSDAIDLLDAKLAEDPPSGDDQAPPLPSSVTEAQLENALENVIRKMYAEKIDQLLNAAIEKTVAAEIENLKQQLLNESPED